MLVFSKVVPEPSREIAQGTAAERDRRTATRPAFDDAQGQEVSPRCAVFSAVCGALAVMGVAVGGLTVSDPVSAQTYDSIIGEARTLGEPTDHWFSVTADDMAYLVDGDDGRVQGTLTLSMYSPALAPQVDAGKIFSYGSFYTRMYYGERTDVVLIFDLESTIPVAEVEIPPKSAGIGHPGMIGLIDDRYIGVWNITPAMSVSIVDTQENRFVGEISTPGCAGVYPVEGGFLMPCADGRVQLIELDESGTEVDRRRSEPFFSIDGDPVFDYAVEGSKGWMFMSLEGLAYEVSLDNESIVVSDAWAINPPDVEGDTDLNGIPLSDDDSWRIGGSQPFAYSAAKGILATLMHDGGGQESFEDAGSQIWVFSEVTGRRAYAIELEDEVLATGVQLTGDEQPLLLVATTKDGEVRVYDALSGRLERTIGELGGGWGATIQRVK